MKITQIVARCLKSNTFILEEEGKVVIIDAGASVSEIESVYPQINEKKVMAILLTHSHFDHIRHLDELIDKFNCNAFISELGFNFLFSPKTNLSFIDGFEFKIVRKDKIKKLSNGEQLNFLNTPIKVIFTKGHCLSSVCYLIDDVLFAGDTLFSNCVGRTDLFSSSNSDMLNSLKMLKKLKFNRVYAGHDCAFSRDVADKVIETFIKYLSRSTNN